MKRLVQLYGLIFFFFFSLISILLDENHPPEVKIISKMALQWHCQLSRYFAKMILLNVMWYTQCGTNEKNCSYYKLLETSTCDFLPLRFYLGCLFPHPGLIKCIHFFVFKRISKWKKISQNTMSKIKSYIFLFFFYHLPFFLMYFTCGKKQCDTPRCSYFVHLSKFV